MISLLIYNRGEIISKKRILICASGRGSNFRAVFGAIRKGGLPQVELVGLLTDRFHSQAEQFARDHEVPVRIVDFASCRNRVDFDKQNLAAIHSFQPDLIMTLGYMRILGPRIIRVFPHRIINLHPSLLPAFPGMRAQAKALAYGVRFTGVTMHFVDEGLDTGPIIDQRLVEVLAQDTEASLSERIRKEEHKIVIEVIRLFCQNRLRVQDSKTHILSNKRPANTSVSQQGKTL